MALFLDKMSGAVFAYHDIYFRWPEEYTNFYWVIDTSFAGQTMYTVTKDDNQLHQTHVDIMESQDTVDAWFKWNICGDLLFFSDYSGIKVYNEKLEVLFQLDINEQYHYNDVYCFSYNEGQHDLRIWLASKRIDQDFSCSYHDITNVDPAHVIHITNF
jgi:hypothetical protein